MQPGDEFVPTDDFIKESGWWFRDKTDGRYKDMVFTYIGPSRYSHYKDYYVFSYTDRNLLKRVVNIPLGYVKPAKPFNIYECV